MLNNLIKILNSPKFAFTCLIGFIIPFFVFSFWNHLSADDYYIGIKKQTENFWPIQYYYYTHWHGRYISIFSTSVLVFSGLLYSKTYLIGTYFLITTLLSFLYLTFQINRYVLKNMFSFFSLIVISLLLLVMELNVIPQPVTAFYWYSGAITYQQPLIFLMLLSGSAVGMFYSSKRKKLYASATLIFLVCMQGYNEMITIWFLINTTLSAIYYIYKQQKNKRIIIVLMTCNYITAVILLFAPGNFHRAATFDHSSAFTILAISFGRFIVLNWFFLKEPLWWFLLLLLSSKEGLKQPLLRNSFFVLLKEIRLIYLLLLYTFFSVCTYFPILYVSNGSIPNRMENQLCFLSGLTVMFIIYLKLPEKSCLYCSSVINNYRFLLISIFIFCTSNLEIILQTICSGYFYNQVMEERLSKLKSAQLMQLPEIKTDDYTIAVRKKINAQFPIGARKTLMELMEQKPPLLFFTDDLSSSANVVILQKFYNIDTITVNRK